MQEKHLAARALDLDLLRLLCSFLVIVNHTYDYVRLSEASAPVRYASFAAFSFSKIAVPIFLMISGFTLLSKTDDIKKTFSRVLRIGLSLVVFSFVYEVYRYVSGQQDSLSIKRFLLFIYEQHTTTAFWYLYAYLGLLVMLPFLQKLAHAMSKQDFLLYFAIMLFFCSFWPLVVEYTPMSAYNEQFALPLSGSLVGYLFLGYFLHTHSFKEPPAVVCILLTAVSVLLSAAVTNHSFVATSGARYLFLDGIGLLPTVVSSFCMFCLVRRLCRGRQLPAVIRPLGAATFGVYLLADLFISLLFPMCVFLRAHLPALAAVFLYQLSIWAASLCCTLLLRRIPLLRRLL